MISPTLKENAEKLKIAINQAIAWGETEGINFDPGKSELQHFPMKQRDKDLSPVVETNSFTISENTQSPYLRWLGATLTESLHLNTMCRYRLQRLSNWPVPSNVWETLPEKSHLDSEDRRLRRVSSQLHISGLRLGGQVKLERRTTKQCATE